MELDCPNCGDQLERDDGHNSEDTGSGDGDEKITCNECERNCKQVLTCRPCDYDVCMRCAKKMREKKGKKKGKKGKKDGSGSD